MPDTEDSWFLQWHTRFTCWIKSLPINQQQQLDRCPGAMTAALGNRLGVANEGAVAEQGCEAISERGGFLQSLPSFPALPKMPFSAPRMPAGLLPWVTPPPPPPSPHPHSPPPH